MRAIPWVACAVLVAAAAQAQVQSDAAHAEAEKIYVQRCAECHDHPTDRIPPKRALAILRSSEDVVRALTDGVMQQLGNGLTAEQIEGVALYLTGKPMEAGGPNPRANLCKEPATPLDLKTGGWNGWGRDAENTRSQPTPGFEAEDVPRLKVKVGLRLSRCRLWTAHGGRATPFHHQPVKASFRAQCQDRMHLLEL